MQSVKNKEIKQKGFVFSFGFGKEREFFIENLSMLVSSGMSIISALDAIHAEIQSTKMRSVIKEMQNDIEAGSSIWHALDKAKIFPVHTVALIRIGEKSGRLAENLKIAAFEQEKSRVLHSKIHSAMMYPILVLTITLVIGISIAWFVLPQLATVFSQLRLKLPLITKLLIGLGEFLGAYGIIFMPVFLVFFIFVIYFTFYYPKTKKFGQFLLFSLPGVKQLLKEVEIARVGYLLGTLLASGVPITDSLESMSRVTSLPPYQKLYSHLATSVADGNSFQKSFFSAKDSQRFIPMPIQQMITAGEQSGNLSEILLKIGERYDAKTETTTKNLAVILEPVLLIIVWLGVVSVALAIILPVYNLIGGIN